MHIIHANLAKGFRGGERQTVLLIKALAGQAYIERQTLVCQPSSPMREELAGVAKLRIVEAKHQLMGHYALGKGTIIHAHEAKAVHWAWLHHALYKTPYIITRRVDTPIKHKLTNRVFYRNARYCVALSNAIAEGLSTLSPRAIPVIPSALTPSAPNPEIATALQEQYAGHFIIGHIGALVDRHKGQRVLLQAAELLADGYPDLLFLFFGQGEDEAALRNESKHLKNVQWMGFKSNILDYISAFDMFAFPSRNEGLGSILLDVMNAKVPIIASDVGGIPDIVKDKETGLLFASGNAESLKNGIIDLYNNKLTAEKMMINAYSSLKNYTPEAMARSYLDLYR